MSFGNDLKHRLSPFAHLLYPCTGGDDWMGTLDGTKQARALDGSARGTLRVRRASLRGDREETDWLWMMHTVSPGLEESDWAGKHPTHSSVQQLLPFTPSS